MLHRSLPGHVKITAEHYPPSNAATLMSGLLTAAQWSVILAAFGGQSAVSFVGGTPLAPLCQAIQENRMAAAGGAWFLGSSLSASMLKTGAFEVQIRDAAADEPITVWSGIKRGGRPPATMQEMNSIVDALRHAGVGRAPQRMQSTDSYKAPTMKAEAIAEAMEDDL